MTGACARTGLFVTTLLVTLGAGRARAAGPDDVSCVEPRRVRVEAPAPTSTIVALPEAPPPPANAPLPPTPPPPTYDPEPPAPHEPRSDRPSSDEWPLEYVLRPQTIPAGWSRASVSTSTFIPDSDFGTPGAGRFHANTAVGGALSLGANDWLEFGIGLPRVLCFDSGEPSGCSSFNRYNGSGVSLDAALVRRRAVRVRLSPSFGVALSDPMTFSAGVGARAKLLVADWLALELGVGASRLLDAPAYVAGDGVGSTWEIAVVDIQATRQFLLWAAGEPYAPVAHLDHPSLELMGGASWTFLNGAQLGASGGVNNVLARRSTDRSVPGKFAGLVFGLWL